MGKLKLNQGFWRFLHLLILASCGYSEDMFEDPDNPVQWQQDWPTCSELKAMWLALRPMVQDNIVTNEIPMFPSDFVKNFGEHNTQRTRHRQGLSQPLSRFLHAEEKSKSGDSQTQFHNEIFGDSLFQATLPRDSLIRRPSAHRIQQHFLKPEPLPLFLYKEDPPREDTESVFLEPVDEGSFEMPFVDPSPDFPPGWEEMGVFGRFSEEDEEKARQKAHVRTVKANSPSGWHGQPATIDLRMAPSANIRTPHMRCEEIERELCSTEEECRCKGREILKCSSGRCQRSNSGQMMGLGRWFNQPLPSSALGITPGKKNRPSLHQSNDKLTPA